MSSGSSRYMNGDKDNSVLQSSLRRKKNIIQTKGLRNHKIAE
jgi:hypothetical protein